MAYSLIREGGRGRWLNRTSLHSSSHRNTKLNNYIHKKGTSVITKRNQISHHSIPDFNIISKREASKRAENNLAMPTPSFSHPISAPWRRVCALWGGRVDCVSMQCNSVLTCHGKTKHRVELCCNSQREHLDQPGARKELFSAPAHET